jgi:hypothetical protein
MSRRSSSNGAQTADLARHAAAAASERRDPTRRRWGRVGGGLLAAVVGAWLFASLYLSADDRTDVVALARRVERLEPIERSDFKVVSLPSDAPVETVPATRMDELVGRVAATDLLEGSLLTAGQLLPAGERLVRADEAVVGLLVGPGDGPVSAMGRGAAVLAVVRPPAGTTGDIEEVAGWLADVSGKVASNDQRSVEVVVPRADAATVSAAAADRRVTIVVLGE